MKQIIKTNKTTKYVYMEEQFAQLVGEEMGEDSKRIVEKYISAINNIENLICDNSKYYFEAVERYTQKRDLKDGESDYLVLYMGLITNLIGIINTV